MDRLLGRSKTAFASEEEAQDLSRLRDEWETARQCLDICSRADHHLKENVSVIENYGTGDSLQFMVSANGKVLHGTNRGLGWRSRQVGGYMSDESIQQLSRDLATMNTSHLKDINPLPKSGPAPSTDGRGNGEVTADFQDRFGRGFTLKPTDAPEIHTSSPGTSSERADTPRR